MIVFTEKDGSVSFSVRVVPRASKSSVVGSHDGALKVRIASPPVDGAANEELVRFLAKTFGIPRSSVEIIAGQTSKSKIVKLTGITKDIAERALGS